MANKKSPPSAVIRLPAGKSISTDKPSNTEKTKSTAADESRPIDPNAAPVVLGEPVREEDKGATFPIVGVGASAGGLEAFGQLLQHLPADIGMAYVLVQHLAPNYPSALTDLLRHETSMPVTTITDGMKVQPNHIFVIPPNTTLALHYGVLHLMPRTNKRGQHLVIDYFFRSLAEDQGSKAIGIILSGTASDGVLGLKAIKAEGGITFSQDQESAKYDGMPHSAIVAGCVDFILSPEKIAQELVRIARHPYGLVRARSTEPIEGLGQNEEGFNKIFILLRRHSGVDFTYYKQSTIQRRIKRRMVLNRLEKLSDYIRLLQENLQETDALYNDILINVTSFFRDPESFDFLRQQIFPSLFEDPMTDKPLRLWVPGCSTGEETYSIAISLLEHMGDNAISRPIQIFSTDIDERAIDRARAGIYPEAITEDVSAERLRRFFSKVDSGYQINKHVRDMCLFARQNVIKDPPFSKLDLISCRNLMIYLGPVLQKKALSLFHYALKPNRFLFLGSAETIGESADLFKLVDQKHKLYAKKSITTPLQLDLSPPAMHGLIATHPIPNSNEKLKLPSLNNGTLQETVDRLVIKRYSPPGVVINDQMEILQFRGQTGTYLEPAPGDASLNLVRMAREELLPELHSATTQAIKDNLAVRKEGVHLKLNGKPTQINIDVTPIKLQDGAERNFLVLFETIAEAVTDGIQRKSRRRKESTEVAVEVTELKHELAVTKEYLQSVIEQQETTNEELRSANEEIQSSNEELQSINEELETAKEELQSVNEELATVNDELEGRNIELSQLNDDLSNLIHNINIPIVFVGSDLRIQRFSPPAEKTLYLIPGDIGRPIGNVKPIIPGIDMHQIVKDVIDNITPQVMEGQSNEGRWYSMRVRPYKTADNKIDGAVIAFIDIDEIKRGYEIAKDSRDFAEAVVAAVKNPLLVLDKDLRVSAASAAYLHTFQTTEKEIIGNLLYRLGNGQWGIPELRSHLENTVVNGASFDNFTIEHEFERIGKRIVIISGRHIPAGISRPALVLMQIECKS
ncbi:MAG: chemotaxis protein CheB [Pseudomonadota bacterium]